MGNLSRPLQRLNRQLDKLEMAEALSVSDDPAHQALAMMLRGLDPQTGIPFKEIANCTLGRLCQRTGVSYKQIIASYRDWKRSEAVISAAKRLPGIVQGIAEDAETRLLTCPTCEGAGKIKVEDTIKDCIPCEGSGKIRQPGDPVARKQILEMMELSGRGQMNISAPGAQVLVAGESLEDTLRAARQAKNGGGNVAYRDTGRSQADQQATGEDRVLSGEDPS